jgi:NhaP-type Na+/H+ or K+/H+ antiporter
MYQDAAILAAFLLIYSAIAGRIERSWISGPIVFTGIGFVLSSDGLGGAHQHRRLRMLAELTLAMVLFTDAANADFAVVRRNLRLPERLLFIGLPLTIVFGFALAAVVLPSLETLEIALLAAMLAPTDAALGKPVVTNPAVPTVMREALNSRPPDRPRHLAGVALCGAQPDRDPDASSLSVSDWHADEYGG